MATEAVKLKDVCSLEEKLWQTSELKKQRHYFADNGPSSQSYSFSSSHVGIESWTIKKAERPKINGLKLYCWRRPLRVPWASRRSKQSFLKEINPEYSLEGLMLNWWICILATWCEELTYWQQPWCWERLRVGGDMGDRGWDGWHHQFNEYELGQTPDGEGHWSLACLGSQRVGHNMVPEQQRHLHWI